MIALVMALTIAQTPAAPDGLKALKHADARVRFKAAATLARLGPVAKFAAAELEANLTDTDPYVRLKIVEALWRITGKANAPAAKVLHQSLEHKDPNIVVRATGVCGILGETGRPFVEPLIKNLQHYSLTARMEAIGAIQDLGPVAKDALQPLLDLTDDEDFDLLEPTVGVALAYLGKDAVRPLGRVLEGRDLKKRRLAATALASMGDLAEPALRPLVEALTDPDAILRTQSARAVGQLGAAAEKSIETLRRGCEDKDPVVRIEMALAYSLISKKDDRIGVVQAALDDESTLIRSAACAALAELGERAKGATTALRKFLKGEDDGTRLAALLALGKIGPAAEAAMPDLLPLLKQEVEAKRIEAAFVIWTISKKAELVMPTLIEEIDFLPAVQLMEKIGPAAAAAVTTLVEAYQDEDYAYRDAAGRALKAIDPAAAKKTGIR